MFDNLIKGHNDCLKLQESIYQKPIADLLEGFLISLDRYDEVESENARQNLPTLMSLFDGYQVPYEAWAKRQRLSADNFNLLETMGVNCREVCHSKILAWLLDWRINEYGTHAQRELGFRIFLQQFEKRLDPENNCHIIDYADEPTYWVQCEVPGSKSRVDIEIAALKRFVIHIENKILAPEGENETNREWEDLLERAKELGIPRANIHGIFLTLDGRRPKNPENNGFRPVGWNLIAHILEEFAKQAEPNDVKLFACHYAAAVRSLVASKPQVKEIKDAEAIVQ